MAKKKLGLEDLGGFVFSTNDNFAAEQRSGTPEETPEPSQQNLEAHYSAKGRAGKKVTVITGFLGKEEDLKALEKELKKKCGVGGSVKDGEIIIQGNMRDKIMVFLKEKGFQVKRVGG